MPIPDAVLSRICRRVAEGEAADLAEYLRACLPAGAALAPVREAMAERFTPAFVAFALEAVPWLAEDAIPRRQSADLGARVVDQLRAAGAAGLSAAALYRKLGRSAGEDLRRLIASGRVIRERVRGTGGRPADVYRLAEFAAGVIPADHDNPFAFRPRPLD